MNRIAVYLISVFMANTALAQTAELSIGRTAQLISAARPGVSEPQGWAIDLLDVLRTQSLPARDRKSVV